MAAPAQEPAGHVASRGESFGELDWGGPMHWRRPSCTPSSSAMSPAGLTPVAADSIGVGHGTCPVRSMPGAARLSYPPISPRPGSRGLTQTGISPDARASRYPVWLPIAINGPGAIHSRSGRSRIGGAVGARHGQVYMDRGCRLVSALARTAYSSHLPFSATPSTSRCGRSPSC